MANNLRGFAAMDPERQREIARKGGRASHEHGHAHEWTSAEAAEAGRKGGRASRTTGSARKGTRSRPRRNTGSITNETAQNASSQQPDQVTAPNAAPEPMGIESQGGGADIAARGEQAPSRDANTDERSGATRNTESDVERGAAVRAGGRDMDERSGEPPATESSYFDDSSSPAPNPSMR